VIRIAINGFGRIGRCSFKQFISDDRFELVGVNDLADLEDLAYLLKYDSVHGWYPRKVSTRADRLVVDGKEIRFTSEPDPSPMRESPTAGRPRPRSWERPRPPTP
jgi:glyceraldehyde 3-phosphate dehydrogenase